MRDLSFSGDIAFSNSSPVKRYSLVTHTHYNYGQSHLLSFSVKLDITGDICSAYKEIMYTRA